LLSLGRPLEESYLPCWLTGLLKDVFSGSGKVGAFAALYLVTAVVISRVRRQLFVRHIVTQVLVVGAAALVSQGLWLLVWFHPPGLGWGSALGQLVASTGVTVLVTPLALGLFRLLGWRLH
jgi:cell shape-determining protein MreD